VTAEVSIVIVTYNSADLVERAVRSARSAAEASGLAVETIVIDNASVDGSAAVAAATDPTARVIRRTDNAGFGVANNEAIAVATGSSLLLLNPDAELAAGALGRLHAFLAEHPRAAAAAPSIGGPGGVESAGMLPGLRSMVAHFFLLNRITARIVAPGRVSPWLGFSIPRGRTDPRRVEWASAAAVMVRASAFVAVGGFDPAIFMYGEDIDLCERFAQAGWEVWLVPDACADHLIAGSQGRISTTWVDALDRFYGQRAGRARRVLFDLVLAAGLAIRGWRPLGGDPGPEALLHRRRMRRSARRAAGLAVRAIVSSTLS
jgi:GT2 family glycosyltransferase